MNRNEIKARTAALGKTNIDIIEAITPILQQIGYTSVSACEFSMFLSKYGKMPLPKKGREMMKATEDIINKWEAYRCKK